MADCFSCIKCGSNMSRGFSVDTTQKHSSLNFRPSYWVRGEPEWEKSIFGGEISGLIDITGRTKFMLRSLRCDKCGYVEHYAV